MDNVLYASMDVLDVVEGNMPCVCENAFMSVNPHNYDDMLLESMGVVDIPNIKLLKKKAKKFHKNLSKFIGERMIWLLSLMNPINWLKSIRNLLKILLKN